MEAIMMIIGAVTALGMVIVSVGATGGAAAVEQPPNNIQQPIPLVNREKPPLLETDAPVNDREQLRRYFLQEWRGPPIRYSPQW
jgi:hypothetical protein